MAENDELTDYILGIQKNATSNVINAFDSNPDEAARAVDLGKDTGVPASVIDMDLPGFEKQHRSLLTSQLLRDNRFLRDYINSDPMAAKVSHDDLGQLDKVSKGLEMFGSDSVLGKGAAAFKEGFGQEPMMLKTSDIHNQAVRHTLEAAYSAINPVDTAFRAVSGATYAGATIAGELAKKAGMESGMADRLVRDLIILPQLIPAHVEVPAQLNEIARAAQRSRPWLDNGREPPSRIDPVVDKMKADQAKEDAKLFDDVHKEVQASATSQRSPEMLAGFIRQHPQSTTIDVPAEAIRRLYGEEQPSPSDSKLGWVSDIAEQLRAAEATGGDITISTADWLTKVKPEIAEALHDDLRLRVNGLTLNEVKELKEAKSAEEVKPKVKEGEEIKSVELDPVSEAVGTIRESQGWDRIEPGLEKEPEPARGAFNLSESQNVRTRIGNKEVVKSLGSSTVEKTLKEIDLNSLAKINRVFGANQIGEIAKKISEYAKDIPVHVVSDEDYALTHPSSKGVSAHYDPLLNHIVMPEKTYQGAPGRIAYVVLHESIHAATSRALAVIPKAREYVKQLMNEVHESDPTIVEDYGFRNEHEFLAEAMSNPKFQEKLSKIRISEDLAKAMDIPGWRNATGWDTLVYFMRFLFKLPANAVTALEAALSATETVAKTQIERAPVIEKAVADVKAQEGLNVQEAPEAPFEEGKAIGLTKRQMEKLQQLIAKRDAEDRQAQLDRATKFEEKKQSKEWRDEEKKVKDEVKTDINQRPDIAAAIFFRDGEFFGEKLKWKPKINPSFLTDEQKAALPKEFQSKFGANPDDYASMFGYRTGDELVARLADIESRRGDASVASFVTKMISDEVDKRMRYRFGDLGENVLEAAQDHVLGTTQMDLLHEQTIAMAQKAGVEPSLPDGRPFTKENVQAFIKKAFNDSKVGALTVDKYLRNAGKAGAMAELLADKPVEAFKAQQQQYYQAALAREASKFQKEQGKFDRLLKRYNKREVPSVMPEYTEFVHDIMIKVGEPVRRSVQDLEGAIQARGYKNLEDFVESKRHDLIDLPVPEFLYDPNFKKQLKDMSVGEYRAVNNAIKAMDKNGRGEMQVLKEGEAEALEDFMKQAVAQMGELPRQKHPINEEQWFPKKLLRSYLAASITTESSLNRLDKGNARGLFHQSIVYPMTEAANAESVMIRRVQSELREATKGLKQREMRKLVANDLWVDPLTGELFEKFSKRNVLAILQNAGNASNLEKLAKGYNLEPAQVMKWLFENTTKEDWDRAQKIGKVFERLFDDSSRMYTRINDVPLEKLDIEPINTPWGTYDGWYNPVHHDSTRPGTSKKLMGPNALQEPGYVRAATPHAYTKARTGYIAPMELNMDIIPQRLRQMVHDITFREAIIQTSKIFYNKDFQRGAINALGDVRAKEFVPWLKDVANFANFDSETAFVGAKALEFLTQNMIGVLIGLNPYTVGKHGMTAAVNSVTQVGVGAFTKNLLSLTRDSHGSGKTNWSMAFEKSEELQRRLRNWQELLSGRPALSLMGNSWRDFMLAAGSTPVALGDMLSSVPTWLAQYEKSLKAGLDEGQAVSESNRAVRQAHGSSVITNRPSLMRIRNPLGHMFTSLYGFFSHMLQKQYEMAWRAKDSFTDIKAGEYKKAASAAPHLITGLVSYVVIPALVEELFTSHDNHDESWASYAGWAVAHGVSSSFIGIRDFANGLINVREPQAGLLGEMLKAPFEVAKDIAQFPKSMSPSRGGQTIKHAFDLTGVLTGLVNRQEGNILQYIWRYNHGLEHPKGVMDWAHGLKHGTSKPPQHRRY